jgi:competence protein ComEC
VPGDFEGVAQVVEGPFLTQSGQRFTVRGVSTADEDVCVFASAASRLYRGDKVYVGGRLTLPYDLSEAGRAALLARDCAAQLGAERVIVVEHGTGLLVSLSRLRARLSDLLMQSAPGDTGALLSGLVTGDDGGLSREASDAFLSSGTTHITAISGANFAILVILLGVMASGSTRRSLWFIGGAVVAIWLYAAMVGLPPSAFRAAMLATAVLAGRWLGRVPDLLTLTLLLASVQILLRPHDYWSLGFQLSIAATVALIVVFDGRERTPERPRAIVLILSLLAAQLATLPLLAARMGAVSGIGLLANLVVGPLASMAFPVALIGSLAGLASPLIGEVALFPAMLAGDAIIAVVTWAYRHLPGMIQLGKPVPGATAIFFVACWGIILVMSGDLRRMLLHGWTIVRNW